MSNLTVKQAKEKGIVFVEGDVINQARHDYIELGYNASNRCNNSSAYDNCFVLSFANREHICDNMPCNGDLIVEVTARKGYTDISKSNHYEWSRDNSLREIILWKPHLSSLIKQVNMKTRDPQKVEDSSIEEPKVKKHSHYFKDVSSIDEVDVYLVCQLFEIDDSSGALHHAIKKLLCGGKRGAKDKLKDIQEAHDTLSRYLEINKKD